MSTHSYSVTLVPGDGIGPEVTEAAERVLAAAGVKIDWERVEAGAEVVAKHGVPVPDSVLNSIRRNKVALKGPITTPIGQGFQSANVTLRKSLDLYACVRPVKSIPAVPSRFEGRRPHRRAREHRGPLLGARAPGGPGHRREPQGRDGARLPADRPLRLRARREPGTPKGHRRPQGQHHEAHGRPLPRVRAEGGAPVSRGRLRRDHHRQLRHAAGEGSRRASMSCCWRTSTATSSRICAPGWWAASASCRAATWATIAPSSKPSTAARPTSPASGSPTRRP